MCGHHVWTSSLSLSLCVCVYYYYHLGQPGKGQGGQEHSGNAQGLETGGKAGVEGDQRVELHLLPDGLSGEYQLDGSAQGVLFARDGH